MERTSLWPRSPFRGGVLLGEPDVQPPSLEMLSSNEGCLGTWAEVLVCMAYSGLRCCLYYHRHRFHPLWWHVAICPCWIWLLGPLVQFTLDPKKFPSTHHIAAALVAKGSNLNSRCDVFPAVGLPHWQASHLQMQKAEFCRVLVCSSVIALFLICCVYRQLGHLCL